VIESGYLLGTLALFFLIASFFSWFNFTITTSDGLYMIQMGREVVMHGPDSWGMASPFAYGVFLPFLQSASVYLGQDYFYALQPTLGIMFLFSFLYVNFYLISSFIENKRLAFGLSSLFTVALISTYVIFFQLFYIHANFPSAIFLYFAVCGFWLSFKEQNNAWMAFAIMALTGFSLSRTENILFALVVLAIAASTHQIAYRMRLYTYLPFLIFFNLWNLRIRTIPPSDLDVLNENYLYVIVLMLISFGILVLLSNNNWIKTIIIAKLDQISWIIISIGLFSMFLVKPAHMITALINLSTNLFVTGGWGFTWFLLIGLMILTWFLPSFIYDSLFKSVILLFISFVFLLVFFRSPYHTAWYDSGNRMMTTIVPITFTYILLKYGQSFKSWGNRSKPLPQSHEVS